MKKSDGDRDSDGEDYNYCPR